MPVQIFKAPKLPDVNANQAPFFITGAAVQVIKGVVAKSFLPPAVTEDALTEKSYLGTPIIDQMFIPKLKYTSLQGDVIETSELTVNTVVFEVNKPRNIIKTSIQGRNGTVKEYVGNGDYQITCRGMLSSENNTIPYNEARLLNSIFDAARQVPIVSGFLNDIFDIFDIVIESSNVGQVEGKMNEIPFTFVASSDVPIDFEELI